MTKVISREEYDMQVEAIQEEITEDFKDLDVWISAIQAERLAKKYVELVHMAVINKCKDKI